jgi:toxin YoeB
VRTVAFHADAFAQFTAWAAEDSKMFERITRLIVEAAREPFTGIGKPEPLKHQLKGFWSRRINDAHRLVYKATDDMIIVVSCRYHY